MAAVTTFCHLILVHRLPFPQYKLISEWLGAYTYTIPADRYLLPELALTLTLYCKNDLFRAWEAGRIAEHFNILQQRQIIQWILDCNNSHIVQGLHSIPVLVNTNSTN
jgi:hypothetical protein